MEKQIYEKLSKFGIPPAFVLDKVIQVDTEICSIRERMQFFFLFSYTDSIQFSYCIRSITFDYRTPLEIVCVDRHDYQI